MLVSKGILLAIDCFGYPVKIDFINIPLPHFPKTHYSIIPAFQYSNCERSELTCVVLYGCGRLNVKKIIEDFFKTIYAVFRFYSLV